MQKVKGESENKIRVKRIKLISKRERGERFTWDLAKHFNKPSLFSKSRGGEVLGLEYYFRVRVCLHHQEFISVSF